jgi:hypothetical protein
MNNDLVPPSEIIRLFVWAAFIIAIWNLPFINYCAAIMCVVLFNYLTINDNKI